MPQATEEFEKGDFDACHSILNKLSKSRGPDPKLFHNKAILEYVRSSYTRTDEYKKAMKDACAKVCKLFPE